MSNVFKLLLGAILFGSLASAADKKVLTYDADVKPIFRAHCFKCHGEDEKKNGLNVSSYNELMKGGSNGEAVKAGRPSNSLLYQAVAHEGDDVAPMPPKAPKIPDAEIAVIKGWIEQGLIEVEGGKSKAPAFRSLEFKADPNSVATGPAPMPEKIPSLNLPVLPHANAITALGCSPRAPLLAVAGEKRIFLYDTNTKALLGVLPFAEGIPYVLRFSRNGSVLLAAGGTGVKVGKAVLYDVKTGARLGEFGDETDVVLAADISADQKLVAIGGPTKIVKVFSTKDGKLVYKIVKHTDWVTALEFSPDGQKLATADRNGSAFLWEAETGGVLYALSEHKDGINSMSWRGDSEVLATGGEDGQLVLWDAKEGWPVNQVTPHVPKPKGTSLAKLPNGVLSVSFASDGNLYTTGRDNALRAWKGSGGKVGAFEAIGQPVTRLAVSADGKTVFVGDLRGNVWVWSAPGGTAVQPLVATSK